MDEEDRTDEGLNPERRHMTTDDVRSWSIQDVREQINVRKSHDPHYQILSYSQGKNSLPKTEREDS